MRKGILQALSLITFLLIILLVSPVAQALSGWIKTYQGESMDVLTPYSVFQTQDGGYITAIFGYLRSEDSNGALILSYELQILKTDANGNFQWKKSYPTIEDPNHATPTINTYADNYVIIQTSDQGYVIAGGGFWLFKINSQGTVLWSRLYTFDESTGGSKLNAMIQTSDGGFALAGLINTYDGSEDFWLVKTDFQGVAQWNQTYNSGTYTSGGGYVNARDDEATCIIQTSDGGYALVGSSSLFSSSTDSVTYSSWVVKTDSSGNQVWNKGYDLLNLKGYKITIIQTSDNGYAIAGTQNNDFCLYKIKASNQFEWSQLYGDPQTDTPCALVQLEDDGYAIAGTWTPTNATSTRNTMGLIRTDSSGKTSWIKSYSAKEDAASYKFSQDVAYSMIRTSDGSYVLIGSTQFVGESHQDVFFVKTETLEQTPQTSPIPTPATSEPSITESPGQSSQPSLSPTQTEQSTQPSDNINPSASDNNITQIFSGDGTLIFIGVALVIVIAVVVMVLLKIKKK